MTRSDPFPRRWSLVGCAADKKPKRLDDAQLIVPSIPKSNLPPLLAGLLPTRDHNDDLALSLEALPRASAAARPIFSVFAADPFIEGRQIARRLLEKGYKRVINWPTMAQHGSSFAAQLDSVKLGPRQEHENLLRFAEQGLSISITVCAPEAVEVFTRLKPEIVFLAPTFDLWAHKKIRSKELLRRCASIAKMVPDRIPIVLMAPSRTISLATALGAGASGILLA